MLNESKIVWSVDWGTIDRKNWAEKERAKYENENKKEYELFSRKLIWFQGRTLNELRKNRDVEPIGENSNGHKLNFRIYKKTVRIFGYLESNYLIFHALLFLVKKTNQITLRDLRTFKERMKKYEK